MRRRAVCVVGVYAHSALSSSSNDWMKTYGGDRRGCGGGVRALSWFRPSSPPCRAATFTYWTEKQHRRTRLAETLRLRPVNLPASGAETLSADALPRPRSISRLSVTFSFKRAHESRSVSRSVRFGQDVGKAFKTHLPSAQSGASRPRSLTTSAGVPYKFLPLRRTTPVSRVF